MNVVDRKSVILCYSDQFDVFRKPISNLRVRYITVRDQAFDARFKWLSSVFQHIETYDFGSQETYALSTALRDYDILVVGANDVQRIAKFVRANARAISGRVKFVVMDQTDPQRRARVLNAGFDDVFDLSRMLPEEALMRVASVCGRYKSVGERANIFAEKQAVIKTITGGDHLARSELVLLQALCENIGQPVSYLSLANTCSSDYRRMSENHLKVLISKLRRKITVPYNIKAVVGMGYKLFIEDKILNSQERILI